MELKSLTKKYWFWAVVWWALSVIASAVRYDVVGIVGDITHLTIYYTAGMFAFFPTLLTYFILGEPGGAYIETMVLHHIVAIPIYFIVAYAIFWTVRRIRS